MPRWMFPLLLTVSLNAFGQYGGGGITLPGGIRIPVGGTTYPGGQYPTNGQQCPGGQYPTNGQCPGGQYPGGVQMPGGRQMPGMGQMITGNLRQISPYNLTVETDDARIITMQTQRNTRYYDTFGTARETDFDPGDYVTVQASQDMNSNFLVTSVTLTRKATPQERSAANKPINTSMHADDQNTKSDTSTDDRPKMRRADSGSGSASSAASSPASSNDSTSADDGRPRMRRADSGSTDDSSSAAAPVSRAPNSASVSTPMPGDPGPPVLRRGATPRDQTASDSVPERPSVRSEEVNGVTRLPAAPPQVAEDRLPSPSGTPATDDPIIDQTREEAFAFTETLPNYTVKQFTTRYQSDSASKGKTSWQALDIVTADVVAENGKETYKNLLVNGKATKDVDKSGSWSEGEFVSTLQAILSPASDALFKNKRATTIVNRPAWRYDYTIEQPRSSWRVYAGGSSYRPAYGGVIWIDKETSRVLRIEMAARNVPREFPLDTIESTVDYDFVLIGDRKFLLPTHSEALSCVRGTTECTRNVIDFRNYRKYGAETNITFGEPAK